MSEILTKFVVDCSTNESQEIELTKAEIDQIKKAAIASQTKLENQLAEAIAKEAARQAIADRLGLTADELQVLLG